MSPEHIPQIHCHGDLLAGRYRLLQPLAEGGMGSVWSARAIGLDVDVAVKVVKRSVASPEACERLLREARAAASLGHASIVRVLDFGTTDDGEPFLVMQLLRGKTLGGWLRERGSLPAATAVQLLLPIASALAEVHGLGIVHRDIKPENIVLEEGEGGQVVPKLLDFGIAKQNASEASVFTVSGVLMGSPAYMSPEQARGDHRVDARSDVWAFCVVLYEMITGKRPFEGPNHGAILFSVFSHSPEPSHRIGGGDQALWEILRRGMSKTTAERWQSMKQLGHALADWAATRGLTADSAGTSFQHQWLTRESYHPEALSGEPTTEVPRRKPQAARGDPRDHVQTLSGPTIHVQAAADVEHVRVAADVTDHVHTLPSSAAACELGLCAEDARAPARSRGTMIGVALSLVMVSGILTFLSLTPGTHGLVPLATAETFGAATVASHAPTTAPIAAIAPAASPAITLAVRAPDVASAPTAAVTAPRGKQSRPGGHATAGAAGGSSTNRPMPLPSGPDF